jgi:hypothetical protein
MCQPVQHGINPCLHFTDVNLQISQVLPHQHIATDEAAQVNDNSKDRCHSRNRGGVYPVRSPVAICRWPYIDHGCTAQSMMIFCSSLVAERSARSYRSGERVFFTALI